MSLVEFIGFVISLISILFLFFKQKYDQLHNNVLLEDAEEEVSQKEMPLQKIIKDFREEKERKKSLPSNQVPPLPHTQAVFKKEHAYVPRKSDESSRNFTEQKSSERRVDKEKETKRYAMQDAYLAQDKIEKKQMKKRLDAQKKQASFILDREEREERRDHRLSKGTLILKKLPDLSNIIIYQAILGKPKAFEE